MPPSTAAITHGFPSSRCSYVSAASIRASLRWDLDVALRDRRAGPRLGDRHQPPGQLAELEVVVGQLVARELDLDLVHRDLGFALQLVAELGDHCHLRDLVTQGGAE